MKKTILILSIFISLNLQGQRFMIVDGDTVAFKFQFLGIVDGDSIFDEPCPNFEILNGVCCNYLNNNCLQDGLWIEVYFGRTYYKNYKNGQLDGLTREILPNSSDEIDSYYSQDTLLKKEIKTSKGIIYSKQYFQYYNDSIVCFDSLLYSKGIYKQIVKYNFPKKNSYQNNPNLWSHYEVGTTTGWYENGVISFQRYNSNPKSKISIWYRESGYLSNITFYRPDGYMKKQIYFNPNGSISKEENYRFTKDHYNTKHGKFYYYDENGNLIKTEIYFRGKLKKNKEFLK